VAVFEARVEYKGFVPSERGIASLARMSECLAPNSTAIAAVITSLRKSLASSWLGVMSECNSYGKLGFSEFCFCEVSNG
jgi:hypothetical protein